MGIDYIDIMLDHEKPLKSIFFSLFLGMGKIEGSTLN